MGDLIFTFLLLPLFFLACIFSFLIPGLFLLIILGYKKENNIFILATAVGISFFLLLIYTFSWLQLHFAPLFVLGVINILYVTRYRKEFTLKINLEDKKYYGFIGLGALCMVGLTWFSGIEVHGSWYFYGLNTEDGLIHVSRIYNLLRNFPPTHPALAGVPFNGYHYFYDLLLSRFVMFFNFNPYDLYFRYFSVFVAIFYGSSFLYIANKITQVKKEILLILIFAYFSTGFAVFLQILPLGYSSDIAQPLRLIFDPSVLLSTSLLLIFFSELKMMGHNWRRAVIAAILLGVLAQLKVYAGLIGIAVLISYSIYSLASFRKRSFFPLVVVNGIAGVITILTFLPNNLGVGSLVLEPLRFYGHHIQQEFYTFLQWENRRLTYVQRNYIPLVIILYVIAIGVYWVLQLGIKIFLLLFIRSLFKKVFWKNHFNFIISVAITFSLIIPSFFLQSISAFDIGQFFWISLPLMSIPSALVLSKLLNKNRNVVYLLLGAFVFSFLVQIIYEYYSVYFNNNSAHIISPKEEKVYQKITSEVSFNQYITVLPTSYYTREGERLLDGNPPSIVSAMTQRDTYYENEKIEYNLNEIYSERKGNLFSMHEALDRCDQQSFTNAFKRTGTPYLVVQFQSPCLATHSALLEVARSEKAVFYVLEEK